jgi:hypothetical protein
MDVAQQADFGNTKHSIRHRKLNPIFSALGVGYRDILTSFTVFTLYCTTSNYTNIHFACVRPAGNSTHLKKHNTNAQHWNQHDPELYGILLNCIKFYEFCGPPDSLL